MREKKKTEMFPSWRTSDFRLLPILTVFFVVDSAVDSFVVGKQIQNNSTLPSEANFSQSVLLNTKAVLDCPPVAYTALILITWKIMIGDKTLCTRAYRKDENLTKETNCTDEKISWASRPDQNPNLQIYPVTLDHDGYYVCQLAIPDGNFHRGYHLQVLVPPEVTLFLSENRTAVCKADAGKPAAQISWSPEGECVLKKKSLGNGTETVLSTCHWRDSNVSTVTCSVSHVTGNKNLTLELLPGVNTSANPIIRFLPLLIITLVIIGSIYFLKIHGCRKCKSKKSETTSVAEFSHRMKCSPMLATQRRAIHSMIPQRR
ncbi:cell surface glycoprotein CD200 receptor 1 isoform X2 [Tamandua tetradactyla]|uniref:cell surface glycoprotein CD200 receptor 1 isoform X2 n=1 Tax=Tamandua tetradactyla TaxID=48850 RepID=UPI004053EA0E